MMRKFIGLAVLLCLCSLVSVAQDFPKAEVFGGYQFTHLEGTPSYNASGWNGAASYNLNRWLGVTGDFSGAYKGGVKVHSYTFGPTVSARLPMITPFAHALFGGTNFSGGGSVSGFAMQFGGGLDVGSHSIGLRLIQGDMIVNRISGFTSSKNGRVSTGVVFRF
jgi:hypothetical protein